MAKFNEWSEAEDWAREAGYSLEPIGTFTGEEKCLRSWTTGVTKIELFSRFAEVIAVNERNSQIFLKIKEYIVVTTDAHRYGDSDLYHADDWEDAMQHYEYEVSQHR